jgi:hypothetical protein
MIQPLTHKGGIIPVVVLGVCQQIFILQYAKLGPNVTKFIL